MITNVLKTSRKQIGYVALTLLCSLVNCAAQGTIQFEGQVPGSYTSPLGSYIESGVRFTGVHGEGLALVGGSLSGYPDNGTGYLQFPGGSGITIGLSSGAPFNFLSLD